jgi:hypothetical protein
MSLTPNATQQAQETGGARHERSLFPIACMHLQAMLRRGLGQWDTA